MTAPESAVTGSRIHEQQGKDAVGVSRGGCREFALFENCAGAEALHAVDRCMKRMTRGIDGFHGRIVTGPVGTTSRALRQRQRCLPGGDRHAAAGRRPATRFRRPAGDPHRFSSRTRDRGERQDPRRRASTLPRAGGTGRRRADVDQQHNAVAVVAASAVVDAPPGKRRSIAGSLRQEQVFEVLWLEPRVDAPKVISTVRHGQGERELRLCVRYGQLREAARQDIGRACSWAAMSTCEITVHNRRASRATTRGSSGEAPLRPHRCQHQWHLRHRQRRAGAVSEARAACPARQRGHFICRLGGQSGADIAEFEHL
jgi:hypothetical protein